MISDTDLEEWERRQGIISQYQVLLLIAEVRRLREQLKPDCLHGCIFKLARKIAEDGK